MRILLLLTLFICAINGFCQDTAKLRDIDSLVKVINQSNLKPQYDSIFQDQPQLGLNMKTYLTMVVDGKELKKYVNKVNAIIQENGTTRKSMAQNSFFFDQNKLIKVEEFMIEGEKEIHMAWYYSDEKTLYYTYQSEKSEARAALLLTIAMAMQKQIQGN
jgi:hypothetical protein